SPPALVFHLLDEPFSDASADFGKSVLYISRDIISRILSELSFTKRSEYDRCKKRHLGFNAKHQLINDLITSCVFPYLGPILIINLVILPSTTFCNTSIIFL